MKNPLHLFITTFKECIFHINRFSKVFPGNWILQTRQEVITSYHQYFICTRYCFAGSPSRSLLQRIHLTKQLSRCKSSDLQISFFTIEYTLLIKSKFSFYNYEDFTGRIPLFPYVCLWTQFSLHEEITDLYQTILSPAFEHGLIPQNGQNATNFLLVEIHY